MNGMNELPDPVLEQPAKIGSRIFPKGSKVSALVEAGGRMYQYWKEPRNTLSHPMTFTAVQIQQINAIVPQADRLFVSFSDYLEVLHAKEKAEMELERRNVPSPVRVSFQDRMWTWVLSVLGLDVAVDKSERNCRFLEEAAELVQAAGMEEKDAVRIIRWVYTRDKGVIPQEIAGVVTTLCALASAHGINVTEESERELSRIWDKRDKIREKQKNKLRFGSTSYPEFQD